jgi:CubicO group peptidase (beta-lactamase class C family)
MADSYGPTQFKEKLHSFISENYSKASRGISVSVDAKGKNIFEFSTGKIEELDFKYSNSTVYDLASLTKPLATALLVMRYVEKGVIALEDSVSDFGLYGNGEKVGNLTIRSLLTHSSGLIPDYPLYRFGHGKESYMKAIAAVASDSKIYSREEYSDLNFILLGFILEEISGLSLAELAKSELYSRLGMEHTCFNPEFPRDTIAPTELTEERGLVWGKVHDEKAFYNGGVAGHAGLFSNLHDMRIFINAIVSGKVISRSTFNLMKEPANVYLGGMFGLGWMLKVPRPSKPSVSFDYSRFMGDYASFGSIGHTGFTGTSVCFDPETGVSAIILTNRVYPSRQNLNILRLRRHVHNIIYEYANEFHKEVS